MNFHPALVTVEEPLQLKEEISVEAIALADLTAKATLPVLAEVTVQKEENDFLVTGWAQTTLSVQCGKCAEWIPWPVRARVEHLFEAPHPNCIDLTPFIREDILLELPLNAVCPPGADSRCQQIGESYQPQPEVTDSLVRNDILEALSKVKTKD